MAINQITDLAYRKLKPTDKEQLIKDGGGLFVRIRSIGEGGAISFRLAYRFEGKQRWITLKAKSLPDARSERDNYKAMVKQGIDPGTETKLIAERNRVAQLAEQAELARQQALTSVSGLFERWIMTDLQQRKDLDEVQRMFAKDVLPIIGTINAQDIRKNHITDVIDRIKQRGSVHTARNLLKLMRQMFKFAVDRDVIEFDPTASLSVSKFTTKNTERDRVLSQDEIRLLNNQLPTAGLMPSTECAIWIMLSTLCRVGELSKAEWKHIDFDAKSFFIPVENSKTTKPIPFTYPTLPSASFSACSLSDSRKLGCFPTLTIHLMFAKNRLPSKLTVGKILLFTAIAVKQIKPWYCLAANGGRTICAEPALQ